MIKIDTDRWEDFALVDIFELKNTQSITSASLVPDSGNTPYVTAQEGNNGVQMYVDCPQDWLDKGHCILIGGKTLTFSYQEVDFCSNDSHNIALYTKSPRASSKEVQFFLISVLRTSFKSLFSWGDSISMRRAKSLTVKLPSDAGGEPDWSYMEHLMKAVQKRQEVKLSALTQMRSKSNRQIEHSAWGSFRLDDLFKLLKGSRLTTAQRTSGNIPYVGASQFNNGITHFIGNDTKIHPGGVLTVCYNGPVGTTFYQPNPFWATDDVNVLYPISETTRESLLFIAPIIQELGSSYAYTDKWKMEDMAATIIHLPRTQEGEPDWEYMHNYISELLEHQGSNLDSLQSLLQKTDSEI